MRALYLGERLAVAIILSLTLLIVGVFGLGVGIHNGDVVPPVLNVSLSGLHIVAYTTDPIACHPYLPCPARAQDYYVVWVFGLTAPDNVHETWRRILTMPLQRRFDFTRMDRP
jgi:hypothetical protein